jgi:integration host factor subunit beta
MKKLELISALKAEANISKSETATVVQLFSDSMADAMAKGERVEIRGLCSFFVKDYKSYTGRNPKTGQTDKIKALGGKYERIKNIVPEDSVPWNDDLLAIANTDDLFGISAEKIGKLIVSNQ